MDERVSEPAGAPTRREVGLSRPTAGGDGPALARPPGERSRLTPTVKALRTCPGRVVFLEEGNPDAWLATGDAVAPTP